MKHRADWAILSFGLLLMSVSAVRLVTPGMETPWGDWWILFIGLSMVIVSVLRLIKAQ